MHGVYVLDLDTGHFFVAVGDALTEIHAAFADEQRAGTLPAAGMDGSYHFYPCLPGETDDEAERRIFAQVSRQYGSGNVWARLGFRETLAKETWNPSGSHLAADSTPSSATEDKGVVFSISI